MLSQRQEKLSYAPCAIILRTYLERSRTLVSQQPSVGRVWARPGLRAAPMAARVGDCSISAEQRKVCAGIWTHRFFSQRSARHYRLQCIAGVPKPWNLIAQSVVFNKYLLMSYSWRKGWKVPFRWSRTSFFTAQAISLISLEICLITDGENLTFDTIPFISICINISLKR